jgi:serine protease Do
MKVNREGSEKVISATLGTYEDESRPLAARGATPQKAPVEKVRLGFEVQDITTDLAQRYRLDKELKGVLIVNVLAGSDAQKEGVRPGDVIVSVNRQSVNTVKDFEARLQKVDRGEYVLLRIIREGGGFYLPLRVN